MGNDDGEGQLATNGEMVKGNGNLQRWTMGNSKWQREWAMAKGNGLQQKRYSVETFSKIPIILVDTYHVEF